MADEPETSVTGTSDLPTPNGALASRFHQMFPVLSPAEIDRVRRFGEIRRFPHGELLFHVGESVPGAFVILSGRVAITPRDGLGQAVPVAAFAELIGAFVCGCGRC